MVCLHFFTQYCKRARVQRASFHRVLDGLFPLVATYAILDEADVMLKPPYE
jgi:hypothetical protein